MINQLSAIALATVTTIGFMPSALAQTEANYRLYTMAAKNELLRRENTGGLLPDESFRSSGEAFCKGLEKGLPLYITINQFHRSVEKSDNTPEMKRQLKEFYTVNGIYAAIALCPDV
jgi:hypothetical protein